MIGVFDLTEEEKNQDIYIITGMLSISDISTIVLMYSGSMDSIISIVFMDKFGDKCEKTNNVLNVSTPLRKFINTNQMIIDVKLEIEGTVLKADRYILRWDMRSFWKFSLMISQVHFSS